MPQRFIKYTAIGFEENIHLIKTVEYESKSQKSWSLKRDNIEEKIKSIDILLNNSPPYSADAQLLIAQDDEHLEYMPRMLAKEYKNWLLGKDEEDSVFVFRRLTIKSFLGKGIVY